MSGLSPEDLSELNRLSGLLDEGTYYDLFELPDDFDRKALKRAYYDLSRRFHPDRFYRQDLAGLEEILERVFAGLNEAYRVLGSDEERARYDSDLAARQKRRRKPRRARTEPVAEAPSAKAAAPSPPADATPPPRVSRPRPGQTRVGAPQREELGPGRPVVEEAPPTQEHVISWQRPSAAAEGASGPAKAPPEAPPEAPRKRRPPDRPADSPAMARMKQQLRERMKKARGFYTRGLEEAEAGAWVKAASSFYLAMSHDGRNEEYKARFQDADRRAKQILADQHVERARKAESFRNHQEAFNQYKAAADLDSPKGEVWFRLAQLALKLENDTRAALGYTRTAVEKEPQNIEYRMALAEMYEQQDMRRNAHREYSAVLELKKDHPEAKEGARRTR